MIGKLGFRPQSGPPWHWPCWQKKSRRLLFGQTGFPFHWPPRTKQELCLGGKIIKIIQRDALDCLTCEVTISHAGETVLALTSTLVRPKRENENNAAQAVRGQTCTAEQPHPAQKFQPGRIVRYTQLSGDRNGIHQGDHRLCRACSASWPSNALALQGIFCRRFSVQYKRPLYASEDLALYLQNDFLSGKVQNQLHLKLKWEA